jgi:hypothetical protein
LRQPAVQLLGRRHGAAQHLVLFFDHRRQGLRIPSQLVEQECDRGCGRVVARKHQRDDLVANLAV